MHALSTNAQAVPQFHATNMCVYRTNAIVPAAQRHEEVTGGPIDLMTDSLLSTCSNGDAMSSLTR